MAAAEYEKQTGVKVVVDTVPQDDAYSKLQASLSSGTPYDIGTLAFAGHMLILAEAGKLVPMTKLIENPSGGRAFCSQSRASTTGTRTITTSAGCTTVKTCTSKKG